MNNGLGKVQAVILIFHISIIFLFPIYLIHNRNGYNYRRLGYEINSLSLYFCASQFTISKPLTEELIQEGHTVTVISSKQERQKDIEALGAAPAIGSIEDVEFLTEAFKGNDAVYAMIPPGGHFFNHNFDIKAFTNKSISSFFSRQKIASNVICLVWISIFFESNGLRIFEKLFSISV